MEGVNIRYAFVVMEIEHSTQTNNDEHKRSRM